MGHIKDLPKEKLSVDIENNFEPQYVIVGKKKEVIKKIQDAAEKAKEIYIATDPDREGEAIASHVLDVLCSNGKFQVLSDKLRRIVFHEITKAAVEEAISHPGKINKNLVDAQIARRVLDRLVGYKLSPLLWKKVRRGLSAGRVQSVAVRLIVEREREIEAFKPEEYWEIWASVKGQVPNAKSRPFDVKLIKINDKKAEVENERQATAIVSDLEKSSYKVFDIRKKEVRKNPYPPFTTSTMTQAATRLLGWSAKRTMNVAQRLYEEGLITYHRTDSVNLASAAVEKVRDYIAKKFGKNYLPPRPRFFKKTSKLAQEAHEAIRPTDVNIQSPITNHQQHDAKRLYELIWKRFVACQMEASVFDETVIYVQALGTRKTAIDNLNKKTSIQSQMPNSYLLKASGQVMKFDGWRKVIPPAKEVEKHTESGRWDSPGWGGDQELPLVKKDEVLDLIKVFSEQKFTQPPPRYNEASLIKTLEKLGIGRPSTYAPIITTIQLRNYVEKEEGKFKPTPVGLAVNDFLLANFPDVFEYSFTAEMEDNLDNIAKGNLVWQKMMRDFYSPFEKKLGMVEEKAKRVKIEAEKLGKKCPTCEKEGRSGDKQGELVVRTGRFGKFISCSLFPECKHTEKYMEKLGIKCPECKKGDVVVKTTKKGKKFYGCSRYPACKWASWRKPEKSRKQ